MASATEDLGFLFYLTLSENINSYGDSPGCWRSSGEVRCQGKAPIETALCSAHEMGKVVPGTRMGRTEEELKGMGTSRVCT